MNNYAFIIPLIVVVIVGLIETILVAKWNPFYFDDVHGSITIDSENRQIVFKSRIGISYILAFCYLFYIFVFLDGFDFSAAIIFSFIIVLICLISLAVERRIYKKMIDEITRVITNY